MKKQGDVRTNKINKARMVAIRRKLEGRLTREERKQLTKELKELLTNWWPDYISRA